MHQVGGLAFVFRTATNKVHLTNLQISIHRRHTHIWSVLYIHHSAVRRSILRGADRTPARPDRHHSRSTAEHAAHLLYTNSYPRHNFLHYSDLRSGLLYLCATEGRRGRRTQPAVSRQRSGHIDISTRVFFCPSSFLSEAYRRLLS